MRRALLAAAALAGLALASLGAAGAPKALVGGLLLDGTGGAPLPNSVVIIDGDRITAIGQLGSLAIPEGADVVSTEGMTVLPGLIDMQARLCELGHGDRARWREAYLPIAERVVMPIAARALLLAGVTTARDVGCPLDAALAIRERIRTDRIPGPTLIVSGPALGHEAAGREPGRPWIIDGAADARQKAERLVRAGVDYLLVTGAADLADAELAAIADTSRVNGVRWYAEVRRDADIARSLAAGATGLVGAGAGIASTLPADALAELGTRAARNDPVYWSFGASALTDYEWLRGNPEPLDDPRLADGVPPIIAADIRASLANLGGLDAYETPTLRRAVLAARLRSARSAGARLLAGSDAGEPAHLPARATWQEIEALVLDGGLTPLEALGAATLEAAAALGLEHETGSLTPGKYADIIVVRGDPLRHIERLQDVEIVIRHGLRYR